ncbi:MAG: sulfatase-like hydrolase/transferase [Balneola sp.]
MRFKKNNFLNQLFTGVCLLLMSCFIETQAQTNSPNILFIFIDDLNVDITSYGGPIKTPYIDQLAASGAKFNRTYVQQPICAASRASILAGLRPNTVGVDYPYSYYFVEQILPSYGIISDYFDKNGYYVKQFGKIHHGLNNVYQGNSRNPQSGQYVSSEAAATRLPYEKIIDSEEDFADYAMTTAVIEELESVDPSRPFLIMAGLKKPHLPFSAPEEFWDLYGLDEIELPQPTLLAEGAPNLAVDRYYLNQYNWETDDEDIAFSDDYAKLIRQSYYASTSFTDDQVGRMMNALKENGLEENTIVFLISDHGFLLGEQNYWGKANLFEKGLKVPFIISWKGQVTEGIEIDALVESVDLFPTMAEMAGLEVPEHLEGNSVKPLLSNPDRTWKSAVYSQYPRGVNATKEGFSIRTDQYRYTEWLTNATGEILARELYDYEVDPDETRNLIDDEEYANIISELAIQLHEGWKSKLPEGITNNAMNPVAPPSYAWGNDNNSENRRNSWHQAYGGSVEDGWRIATRMRLEQEGYPPGYINWVLVQDSRASTYESCCGIDRTPDLAFDGKKNTYWSSAWSDGTGNSPTDPNLDSDPDKEWIDAEFDDAVELTSVSIHWGEHYSTEFVIQTSLDGVRWQTMFSENNGKGATDTISFDGNPVTKYLRMKGLKRDSIYGHNIVEINFEGPVSYSQPPSLAIVGPASGTEFGIGEDIEFIIQAQDNGNIEYVALFANGDSVGVSEAAPYPIIYYDLKEGETSFYAKTIDDEGMVVYSDSITLIGSSNSTTIRLEAEDAILVGNVTRQNGLAGASKGSAVYMKQDASITWNNLNLEKADETEISVRYLLPLNYKENFLLINGEIVDTLEFNLPLDIWMDVSTTLKLTDEIESIGIGSFWGFMTFDYIDVTLKGIAVSNEEEQKPIEYSLKQNYPNPFNPTTQISYSIPEATDVQLEVYSITGQKVATLMNGLHPSGDYSITWDASGIASGLYIYQLKTHRSTLTKKMLLVK